jgi:GNAT superfamily N-acetyltransferase
MPIATRHRNDSKPAIPSLGGLSIHLESSASVMAGLQTRAEGEIRSRFDSGHRAYVATLSGSPAAWGWVATATATIGEVQSTFAVTTGERYLWNFVTLKSHRGLGIYPRLLDAIVEAEMAEADRFWVAYAPENHASGAGIRKAGFTDVAELSFDADGKPAVRDILPGGGTSAAKLLGLPQLHEVLSQCWKCARAATIKPGSCAPGACSCDYQRPEVPC